MRISVLFCAALLGYVSATCRIFNCKSIKNRGSGDSEVCGALVSGQYHFQSCPKKFQCSSLDAFSPTDFASGTNATCQPAKNTTKANLAAGYVCNESSQCFGDGTCTNNVCQAPGSKEGDSCSDTLDCGTGLYCSLGQCTFTAKRGETCNSTTPCSFGNTCVKNGDASSCVGLFRVEDGTLIGQSIIGGAHQLWEVCRSGNAYSPDNTTYYCMPGSISLSDTKKGRTHDSVDYFCQISSPL